MYSVDIGLREKVEGFKRVKSLQESFRRPKETGSRSCLISEDSKGELVQNRLDPILNSPPSSFSEPRIVYFLPSCWRRWNNPPVPPPIIPYLSNSGPGPGPVSSSYGRLSDDHSRPRLVLLPESFLNLLSRVSRSCRVQVLVVLPTSL